MNIIINNSSMQPIYEQIVEQVKADIPFKNLPLIKTLSKEMQNNNFLKCRKK